MGGGGIELPSDKYWRQVTNVHGKFIPSLCSVTLGSLLVLTVSRTHMTQAHERCKEGTG